MRREGRKILSLRRESGGQRSRCLSPGFCRDDLPIQGYATAGRRRIGSERAVVEAFVGSVLVRWLGEADLGLRCRFGTVGQSCCRLHCRLVSARWLDDRCPGRFSLSARICHFGLQLADCWDMRMLQGCVSWDVPCQRGTMQMLVLSDRPPLGCVCELSLCLSLAYCSMQGLGGVLFFSALGF